MVLKIPFLSATNFYSTYLKKLQQTWTRLGRCANPVTLESDWTQLNSVDVYAPLCSISWDANG